ncbi:MAG TPA: hypothetical protein VNM92_05260 [Thermoanaerobaculia bacterium]|nr:hypothetical protein [Thermoanaerobaculia bacterium]
MDSGSEVRLHIVAPRGTLPEGTSSVAVDLARYFTIVRRVGHNPGLMLLTLRALRQRRGFLLLRIGDLSWILRASESRLNRWLARLERERLVIYHLTSDFGRELVEIEIIESEEIAAIDVDGSDHRLQHTLPTHWFVQVLPRLGRKSFVCYLYLLAREQDESDVAMLDSRHMARTLGLLGTLHLRWHLSRLHRHRLIRHHPARGVVIAEPPPLTRFQHLRLRLRQLRVVPHFARELAVLLAALGLALWIIFYS